MLIKNGLLQDVSFINEYQSTTLDKSQFNVLFKAPYQLRIL